MQIHGLRGSLPGGLLPRRARTCWSSIPDECIDCTLCEPECPAEAIFSEEELPDGQQAFKKLNAELAKQWPVITEKKDAPADAKEWDGRTGKLEFLER